MRAMRTNLKWIVAFIVYGVTTNVFAQQNITFYNMQAVNQSNYVNPARMPKNKVSIGLPVISSTYLGFSNSGFAFSDLVKKNGDSLDLDFNSFLNALSDRNYLSYALHVDLLNVGVRIGRAKLLECKFHC